MDALTAQLRQQIERTHAAMAAKLARLEQYVSHVVAATLEETAVAPVRGVQEAMTRSTTVLQQASWLILALGGLLGYASARPARPVPRPPERPAVAPHVASPPAARPMPAVYDAPRQSPAHGYPAGAGGAHEGGTA